MSPAAMTAIIPTIGRPSLRRAVESVVNQTQEVVPLVVLDDPDAGQSVRQMLWGTGCRLVQTSGRQGGSAARNLGIRAAETGHVAFLDDDDEWSPVKTAAQRPDVDDQTIVSCRAELVSTTSARSTTTPQGPRPVRSRQRVVPETLYDDFSKKHPAAPGSATRPGPLGDYILDRSTFRLRRYFMQTSTLACTREAALQVSWREGLRRHQDWDWLLRLESAGLSIRQRPEVLVRVHQASERSVSRAPDWQSSTRWLESLGPRVSPQAAGDFSASIIARGAFEAGAWSRGLRALFRAASAGAHPSALAVGLSGLTRWRPSHD